MLSSQSRSDQTYFDFDDITSPTYSIFDSDSDSESNDIFMPFTSSLSPPVGTDVDRFIDSMWTETDFTPTPALISSDSMFDGAKWSRAKMDSFKHFDHSAFHQYRLKHNVCEFEIITRCKTSTRLFQLASETRRNRTPYRNRINNPDHHLIPPLCCDANNSSLCWLPLSIPLRRTVGLGVRGSQAIFADFMQPLPTTEQHPISLYAQFLHGKNHSSVCQLLPGYYPDREFMAECLDLDECADRWEQREKLNITDGFSILRKLARRDKDSWANVMAFLPFNEKCGFAQYLSYDTCDRVYGVAYPSPSVRPSPATSQRFVFTDGIPRLKRVTTFAPSHIDHSANYAISQRFHMWMLFQDASLDGLGGTMGVVREQWSLARKIEIHDVKALMLARLNAPFDRIWRLKGVYDLSNFCNRHALRSRNLCMIAMNVEEHLIPTIQTYTRRMDKMCTTKVVLDGSAHQDYAHALHTKSHFEYMQAWTDLASLVHLDNNTTEPSTRDINDNFAEWRKHSLYSTNPLYQMPSLYARWYTHRLLTINELFHRYTGNTYHNLLDMMYQDDCALRSACQHTGSHGHTTQMDLLAYQISCCVAVDHRPIQRQCEKHNYQEMECDDTDDWSGCNCSETMKASTRQAVYTPTEFDTLCTCKPFSKIQKEIHQARKRVHTSCEPIYDGGIHTGATVVAGLERLLSGSAASHAFPPLVNEPLRHTH